jgi:4-amino-4-deoxy-L-arabinose transferase-like glycosyltransferase
MEIVAKLKRAWLDCLLLFGLIVTTGFLTLYQLGNQSLHPWDEAWYATISRNLQRSGDLVNLRYNDSFFWDHPPLTFYLTSLSFTFFGTNEFAARLPQALLGIATVSLIFITGSKLKNRWVGLIAALIVMSSRWFLFRARTGNIDTLLIFTQTLFFLIALTTREHRRLWLPALCFGLAMSAKSFISITLSPLLLLAYYERHSVKKITSKEIIQSVVAFLAPLFPWYGYNTIMHGLKFLMRNIFEIGLRSGSAKGVSIISIKQTLLYFHAAVHRWFSIFFLSALGAMGLFFHAYIKKNWTRFRSLGWVLIYFGLVSFPYLLSAKTEIWHLIPLVSPMALIIALTGWYVIETLPKKIFAATTTLFIIAIVIISASSIKAYWPEFVHLNAVQSDAATISKQISNKSEVLYLTNDAFYPTVVYYADMEKKVVVINEREFEGICRSSQEPFLFMTSQSFLDKVVGWTEKNRVEDLVVVEFTPLMCGSAYEPITFPQ